MRSLFRHFFLVIRHSFVIRASSLVIPPMWPRRIDARHEFAFARQRIGLLAGWGDYAVVVARALKRQSYEVFCVGIKGHTSEELIDVCDDLQWSGLCKVGAGIRYFRRHGVRVATMAGKYP